MGISSANSTLLVTPCSPYLRHSKNCQGYFQTMTTHRLMQRWRNLRIATNGSTDLVRGILAKLPSQRHNYLPDAEPERRPTEKELNSLRYHVHARHYTDGTLKIFNLLPMPVTVTGIRTSYEELGIELPQIPPKGEVQVQTGWSGPQDDDIFVDTEVQGSLASYQTSLSLTSRQNAP